MLDRPLFLVHFSLFVWFLVCIVPSRCLTCKFSCRYPLKMSLNGVITEIFKETFNVSPVVFRFYWNVLAGRISPLGDCTVQNPSIKPEGS